LEESLNNQKKDIPEHSKLLESGSEKDIKAYIKEIKRQINSAKEIQYSILPDNLPPWNCIKFAARYLAMDEIGGDYYDTFKIKGDRLGLIMADVSGHGIPAALVTTMAKVAFATHGQRNTSTKELLYNVNKDLTALISSTGFYMTCFALNIDKDLKVRYTNAGHQKAILYRDETDTFEYLDTNGLFLGVFDDAGETYEEDEVQLYPGDRIILYTDGIVETMNKDKEEYGEERFEDMIRFSSALESEQVADLVIDDIKTFSEGARMRDDVSILVLEVELRYKKYLDKVEEAEKYRNEEQMSKWRKSLEEAVRINPDSLKSRKSLASYYIEQKEYEKALKHLKYYVEKNQESPYIYTLLGFCHFKLNRTSKAISTTKKALHIHSKYQEALQNLAFFYIKEKDFNEAKKYIQRLKDINKHNPVIESLEKLIK
jgi:phosphoserine phosphatase RsbU/P